jgi:hypothetical protein
MPLFQSRNMKALGGNEKYLVVVRLSERVSCSWALEAVVMHHRDLRRQILSGVYVDLLNTN